MRKSPKFESFWLLFIFVLLACSPARAAEADPSELYLFVVPEQGIPTVPAVHQELGHGLYKVLIFKSGDKLTPVSPDDLQAMGLTYKEAEKIARDHLAESAEKQEIQMRAFEGPDGRNFILFGGSRFAATCIMLPDLAASAAKIVGSEELCVSIPHAEAMIIFPKGNVQYREAIVRMIQEKEAWGEHRLTDKLFELKYGTAVPLDDEPVS